MQFMWLTLYLRFYIFNFEIQRLIQLASGCICLLYCLSHFRSVLTGPMLSVTVYTCATFLSSFFNYGVGNLGSLLNSFLYSLKVFEIFAIITIVGKRRKVEEMATALLRTSLVVWVPTVISVFVAGRGVDNAVAVYLIGNKFAVAYFNLLILVFLGILSMQQHPQLQGYAWKNHNAKKQFWWFFAISVFLAWYMTAYTGLVMLLIIGILTVLGTRKPSGNKANRSTVIYGILKKPAVLVISMLVSGYIIGFFELIITSANIADFLETIGKTGTIASRAQIFSNLPVIISKKPLWGYGYGSMIVTTYYGVNPQNGLMETIIYFGYIGMVLLLILSAAHLSRTKYVRTESGAIILYCIYAFVASSIVEITYSNQFFILLALFNVCVSQDAGIFGSRRCSRNAPPNVIKHPNAFMNRRAPFSLLRLSAGCFPVNA